jgi:hypothetical protein
VTLEISNPDYPEVTVQTTVDIAIDNLLAQYEAAIPGVWRVTDPSGSSEYTLRADKTGWRSRSSSGTAIPENDPFNQARWSIVRVNAQYYFRLTYIRTSTVQVTWHYGPFSLPLATYPGPDGATITKLP